jgi:hypothetical protein
MEKGTFERMNISVREALQVYVGMDNWRFGNVDGFVLTPDKPNTARTVFPVKYAGHDIGDMYVIAFSPGDGTGDESAFKLGSLELPEELVYDKFPAKVLPRKKDGILYEICFPIATVIDEKAVRFAVSLDELTVDCANDPKTVVKAFELGLSQEQYHKAIKAGNDLGPKLFLTTGHKNGLRFGDPHAIHYGVKEKGIQIAGFLAIKEEEKAKHLGKVLTEIIER